MRCGLVERERAREQAIYIEERAREEYSSREAYWTEKVKKARRAILTRTREDIDTCAHTHTELSMSSRNSTRSKYQMNENKENMPLTELPTNEASDIVE